MSEVELAYLAGFLDRSSFIGIIKYKDYPYTKYTIRLAVQCASRATLKPLAELVGVKLGRTSKGKDFTLTITGRRKLQPILISLLPYLRAKKKIAEKAIQFCDEWSKVIGDDDEREMIRLLRNQRVEESEGLHATWRGKNALISGAGEKLNISAESPPHEVAAAETTISRP